MIHFVLGTKAQLIKMAPIMVALDRRGITYNFVATGQHRDTMQDILANFGCRGPDVTLYSGKDITSIRQMVIWGSRLLWTSLRRKKTIFRGDANGIVLVHGDTFSAWLGALMGKVSGLQVGHVESGLRSYNYLQPFPEEIFRVLTFLLSDFMFCPDQAAVDNLRNFRGVKINTLGNTIADSLRLALEVGEGIQDVAIPEGDYGVVTVHRFENFYSKSATLRMVEAIERIATRMPLLFILHKTTENALKAFDMYDRLQSHANIQMRGRYDYFRFVKLLGKARCVCSDGGSNQEECSLLGVPVLLLRHVTERSDGLGRNVVLSRFDKDIIDDFLKNLSGFARPGMTLRSSPAETIVASCLPFSKPSHS